MRRRYVLALLAIALLIPIRRLAAQARPELKQEGVEALQAGRFAAAARIFSRLAKTKPSAETYYFLATAEGGEGNFSQAILHFRKSIQLGGDTPDIRYILGLAYLKDHQPDAGIHQLELAVSHKPDFTQARYALGLALLNAKQPRDALSNFEQVRTAFAKNPWMWTNLVRAQFAVDDRKAALATIDSAASTLPENAPMLVALANICLANNQPQKARDLLENANEISPGDNHLKLLLAQASLQAIEPAEIMAVLKDVPDTEGAPGEVAFLKASALMLTRNAKGASPLAVAAVAADPRNIKYLSTYAEIQALQEDYKGALASLNKARLMQPHSPDFPYEMALVYVRMKQYREAIAACEEAARLDPSFDQAYFLEGALHLDAGENGPASEAFHQAATLKPDSALYHAALGASLLKAGNLAESKKELDQAIALDPKTVSAYLWRAQLFERQNQSKQAIADLEVFVALDPNYPAAYLELAQLYSAEGQMVKASFAHCNYQQTMAKIKHPGQTPFFLNQLGSTVFRQAHTQEQ